MGSAVLFSHLNYAFGDCPSFAASPALKSHAWVGHKWVVSAGDAVPAMQRMLFGALGCFFNEKNYYELFIKFSEGLNSESQKAFASVQGKDGCRSLLWVVPRVFLRRLDFKKQNKAMGKNKEEFRCQETAFFIFYYFKMFMFCSKEQQTEICKPKAVSYLVPDSLSLLCEVFSWLQMYFNELWYQNWNLLTEHLYKATAYICRVCTQSYLEAVFHSL